MASFPLGYQWVAYQQIAIPVADKQVLLVTGNTIEAKDIERDTVRWRYQAEVAGQATQIQAAAANADGVAVLALSSHVSDAVAGPYQRTLIRLDARSGVVRWKQALDSAALNFQYAFPTMLWLDEQAIYYYAFDLANQAMPLELSAYDLATGKQRWQRPGCEHLWGRLGRTLVATCQDMFVRIDTQTGQWLPAYPTAIPTDELVDVQLVQHGDTALGVLAYVHQGDWQQRIHTDVEIVAYELATGRQRWWHKRLGQFGGMVIRDDALAFRVDKSVLHVTLANGTPTWNTELSEQSGTGLLLAGATLFTSSDVSILHAIDWQHGQHLWEADLLTLVKPAWSNVKLVQATQDRLLLQAEYHEPANYLHLTGVIALGTIARQTWPMPTATPSPTPTVLPTPLPFAQLRQQIQPVPDAEAITLAGVEQAGQATTSFRALRTDLDGDGTAEWLVTTNYLRMRQGLAGADPQAPPSCNGDHLLCQSTFVIFAQDPQQPGWFSPVHFVQFNEWSHLQWWEPEIIAVQDLTHDGKSEIVLAYQNCGAHTCIKGVQVGQWDGRHWTNLTSLDNSPWDTLVLSEPEITVADPDGDQIYEIRLHGGIVDSVGAGIQRKRTQIYRYSNGSYHWATTIPDPDDDIYFLLQDAHHALAQGEFARTQVLSQQIRTWWEAQPDPKSATVSLTPNAAERIATYAAILGILAAAEQQKPILMKTIFEWIETRQAELNNPYVAAAERLWTVYQTTGDAKAACQAMARRVREQIQDAEFYSWYGYNMEHIDLRLDSCPLSVQ